MGGRKTSSEGSGLTSYHLNFELGDDPLVSLREDLAAERRRLASSERAEMERRVVNRELWLDGLRYSRRRIHEMELRLKRLEALEPNEAA